MIEDWRSSSDLDSILPQEVCHAFDKEMLDVRSSLVPSALWKILASELLDQRTALTAVKL